MIDEKLGNGCFSILSAAPTLCRSIVVSWHFAMTS